MTCDEAVAALQAVRGGPGAPIEIRIILSKYELHVRLNQIEKDFARRKETLTKLAKELTLSLAPSRRKTKGPTGQKGTTNG